MRAAYNRLAFAMVQLRRSHQRDQCFGFGGTIMRPYRHARFF
jgi:hypothetical protein